jgi:dihydroorotate dehydrogenase electron transfer subunit
MLPGQFAQLKVEGSPETYLRRPISIHDVTSDTVTSTNKGEEVSFLIALAGKGTRQLATLKVGDTLNCIIPLGRGFSMPTTDAPRILLCGGGVGIAPLLLMGRRMKEAGFEPTFLLGGRSAGDILRLSEYEALGKVYVTTEDGSMGEQGFVTQHSLWDNAAFDRIAVCGPMPMMKAVARLAKEKAIDCEVSLENLMACGIGACLCCVEDTKEKGHVCVCKEGPVFNINELKWQI